MIKKILSVLALSSVAVMGLSSVSASAMSVAGTPISNKSVSEKLVQTGLIVNSKNGVALRDKNCKRIGSVANRGLIQKLSNPGTTLDARFNNLPITKTCRINGKNVRLNLFSELNTTKVGYAQSSLMLPVYSTQNMQESDLLTSNFVSKSSLNLRDKNCKKIGSVKADYSFETLQASENVVCKFGNKYYEMLSTTKGYVSPVGIKVINPL